MRLSKFYYRFYPISPRKMENLLYIPFGRVKGLGGPSTFMKNLKLYLEKNRFPYARSPRKAGAIFFPNSFYPQVLAKIRRKGGKAIQRLDGIFYPSKHGEKYLQLNKGVKDIYLNHADFIIFQSEHSQKQCFAMFGPKESSEYTVVLNGVDKAIFKPGPDSRAVPGKKIKFITSGKFRNRDMVEPIIQALDALKGRLDFEFWLAGPVENRDLRPLLSRDYLRNVVICDPRKLALLLGRSDIFIYSFLNPPCPNSVLEAISCGLPVVSFDSGAMSELLPFSRELLAPVSDDIFQRYEDFRPERLAEKILLAVENHTFYKQQARDFSSLYSFEDCGQKYLEVFRRLLGQDSPQAR